MDPAELTIFQAQHNQPWTVAYSPGVFSAMLDDVPHILASHTVLHAAKSVGKLAGVFEALDHRKQQITDAEIAVVGCMAADLVTAALRLANLYGFDLATVLCNRVKEKNGVGYAEVLAVK
jgi:hypothetical protein